MTKQLVLIEPYAGLLGGHHQRTLVALAQARPGTLVIALNGIAPDAVATLRGVTARLVTRPVGLVSVIVLTASRRVARVSTLVRRVLHSRHWPDRLRRLPHQITLIARCLVEASALRTARRLQTDADTVVILTASEALHGTAALLGGQPHLRFVHEAVTAESPFVRFIGRLTRRSEQRVIALYPTQTVGDQFAEDFPDLPAMVRAFAVDDGLRLTDTERESGRTAFGIPATDPTVCLVGGWWPYKDLDVIDAAWARLREPLHLLVTGDPLDESVLARWRSLPFLRLHVVPGPVAECVLRLVYGAADAALVARRPGVGKESGLVMDAARLGIPLIVSDHDPTLTGRLQGQPWVLTFPAGDASGLAHALHSVIRQPPEPPGPEVPGLLGMPTAADQADFLTRTFTALTAEES
ncbi:hypothetical protein ABZ348_20485 [Streptomyces sp. NPDC005963]|uniref:hypothetical protein n=1 Tax=Streptomyces sp. NPDC005963 TaxID=3156721 RepID=UPI0033C33D21